MSNYIKNSKIPRLIELNKTLHTTELYIATVEWWKSFRPKEYTCAQHFENPYVNMTREVDKKVAQEIVNSMSAYNLKVQALNDEKP